jgi:short-subunit dehydrogenase
MDLTNKTALITGASSGIGAALAREFARRGANVVMLARRVEMLDALATELHGAGVKVWARRADVTVDGDVAKAVNEVLATGTPIDYVVANAGFGVVGKAQKLDLADYRRQFDTNIYGVLRTFYESLDALKASRGHFAAVGSLAGHVSMPGGSAYAMSKFAVRAFAEAVRGDVAPLGIRVTLISPGFVDSDIRRVDNRGGLHEHVQDPVPAWLRMKADVAARIIVAGVVRAKAEVIVTFHAKVAIFFARHFPRATRYLLSRSGGSRPEPKR